MTPDHGPHLGCTQVLCRCASCLAVLQSIPRPLLEPGGKLGAHSAELGSILQYAAASCVGCGCKPCGRQPAKICRGRAPQLGSPCRATETWGFPKGHGVAGAHSIVGQSIKGPSQSSAPCLMVWKCPGRGCACVFADHRLLHEPIFLPGVETPQPGFTPPLSSWKLCIREVIWSKKGEWECGEEGVRPMFLTD